MTRKEYKKIHPKKRNLSVDEQMERRLSRGNYPYSYAAAYIKEDSNIRRFQAERVLDTLEYSICPIEYGEYDPITHSKFKRNWNNVHVYNMMIESLAKQQLQSIRTKIIIHS